MWTKAAILKQEKGSRKYQSNVKIELVEHIIDQLLIDYFGWSSTFIPAIQLLKMVRRFAKLQNKS
jgi:hypothetical protein